MKKLWAFVIALSIPLIVGATHTPVESGFSKAKGRVLSATDDVLSSTQALSDLEAKLMNTGGVARPQIHRAVLNLRKANTRYRIVSRDVLATSTMVLQSGEAIWETWSD